MSMQQEHHLIVDHVSLGKKGQITLPKKIRDEDQLQENDLFLVMHTPGGDIVLRKKQVKQPEDMLLDAVLRAPSFNWREAWNEVREERRRERA